MCMTHRYLRQRGRQSYLHPIKVLSITTKKREVFPKIVPEKAEDSTQPVSVPKATCKGCPAGRKNGLCQHCFASLLAAEYGTQSAADHLPRSRASLHHASQGLRAKEILSPNQCFTLFLRNLRWKMKEHMHQSVLVFLKGADMSWEISLIMTSRTCALRFRLASWSSRMEHIMQCDLGQAPSWSVVTSTVRFCSMTCCQLWIVKFCYSAAVPYLQASSSSWSIKHKTYLLKRACQITTLSVTHRWPRWHLFVPLLSPT